MAGPWTRLPFGLRVALLLLLCWSGGLVVFRTLLDNKLDNDRLEQAARNLPSTIALSELALERYPPQAVARLNGTRLLFGHDLGQPVASDRADARLQAQGRRLATRLCHSLGACHAVLAVARPSRGLWIALQSPLEPVWMFFPLPQQGLWTGDPWVISLALISGGVSALALLLLFEVQRPIRRLGKAMGLVGTSGATTIPALSATPDVRLLEQHFNAMLQRLQGLDRERQTMLAGLAHDINSPLTRLRLRLSAEASSTASLPWQPHQLHKAEQDLKALERITRQFLLYAGSGAQEPRVMVPLDVLITEQTARYDEGLVELSLEPLQARVQPVAMARALSNLIDNGLVHGAPPVRVELRELPDARFRLAVCDSGPGIPEALLAQALEPFRRLDPARRGQGHTGLGLAIVQRIALAHGGALQLANGPDTQGLCAALVASLDPPASAGLHDVVSV